MKTKQELISMFVEKEYYKLINMEKTDFIDGCNELSRNQLYADISIYNELEN